MGNGFSCLLSIIYYQSESSQIVGFGEISRHDQQIPKQFHIAVLCRFNSINSPFRNDQHMNRRLRINVSNDHGNVIFENDISWNLSANYFFKNRLLLHLSYAL
jgi:hypothetical protein